MKLETIRKFLRTIEEVRNVIDPKRDNVSINILSENLILMIDYYKAEEELKKVEVSFKKSMNNLKDEWVLEISD